MKQRSVNLPSIEVRGNEGPVYLHCHDVVSSVLMALAAHTAADPEAIVSELQDINAVALVEARDIYVEGPSAAERVENLLLRLGSPVLEMNAGTAIQYAKRLEDAADAVSPEADRDLRHQFKLRAARQLLDVEASKVKPDAASIAQRQAMAADQMAGAAMVMRLGEAKPAFVQPPHERTENNQIPSAQDVADALINGEERS